MLNTYYSFLINSLLLLIKFHLISSQTFDDLFNREQDINNEAYRYEHNAILGRDRSRKFDKLSKEESKTEFSAIIDKMDRNGDGFVDHKELMDWIQNTYDTMTNEDVNKQWTLFTSDNQEKIDFDHYLEKAYGKQDSVPNERIQNIEKRRWAASDLDGDGHLNKTELFRFIHPEEFKDMKPIMALETLEEMDKNNDSFVDINEYLSDIFPDGRETREEWIRHEKQNFGIERDLNKDGVLDRDEIQNWLLPDSYNRAEAEASHLIDMVDTDNDKKLTKQEMLDKYFIFVGNQPPGPFEESTREDL